MVRTGLLQRFAFRGYYKGYHQSVRVYDKGLGAQNRVLGVHHTIR